MTTWLAASLIASLLTSAGLALWGAFVLDTGRGHTRGTRLITTGMNSFVVTGALLTALMSAVHASPVGVVVSVCAVGVVSLWCALRHPALLSSELIGYLEDRILLRGTELGR